MSSYEESRRQRVNENRAILARLGIPARVAAPAPVAKTPRAVSKKRRYRAPKQQAAVDPKVRVSRRVRGEDPENSPSYDVDPELVVRQAQLERLEEEDRNVSTVLGEAKTGDLNAPSYVSSRGRRPVVDGPAFLELARSSCVPLTLLSIPVTVWELGHLPPAEKLGDARYWSAKTRFHHPYPIGYMATKFHFGREWTMTIREAPDPDSDEHGPLIFRVDDVANRLSFEGYSATTPWTAICIHFEARHGKTRISGPLFFGFSDPFLQAIIRTMDGYVPWERLK